MPARALYITQDITFVAERDRVSAYETPLVSDDLVVLLVRVATRAFGWDMGEISLYLAPDVAQALGFPAALPGPDAAKTHPVLQRARAHGWHTERVRRWMTFTHDGAPAVHIGLAQWMKRDRRNPLWHEDPAAAAYLLSRFHQLLGVAFHANPGVCGTSLMRAIYGRPKAVAPLWRHQQQPAPLTEMTRTEYHFLNEGLAQTITSGYVHCYDVNRAYLAGAIAADLAHSPLYHTGRTEKFHPQVAGLWQVEVPVWNDKRMPHPMGSNRTPGDVVWITTPTLTLVQQLSEQGVIVMPSVLDSYTAPPFPSRDGKKPVPRTKRLTREWGVAINQAIMQCDLESSPAEAEQLRAAFKGCYQQSINGLWSTSKSLIFRSDWFYTADAVTGANLYRKAWSTGIGSEERSPLYIGNVDCVHYASDKEDPAEDRLKKFVLNNDLGGFKVVTLTAEQWREEYLGVRL